MVVVVVGPGVGDVLSPAGRVAREVEAGVVLAVSEAGRVAAVDWDAEPEISWEI
jgi:hypothetical protein